MIPPIYFSTPAADFTEALPIGNGRLGAMIFGRPWRREDYHSERIPLNADSLWYGGPADRVNPDGLRHLPEVRRLLAENRLSEASYLADLALTCTPRDGRPYQSLGELVFASREDQIVDAGYRRELDLDTAVASVQFNSGGTHHQREAFASVGHQVLVFRFESDGVPLAFHAFLRRRPFEGVASAIDERTVAMCGQAGPGGVRYAAGMRAVIDGDGECGRIGQSLVFGEVRAVTLFVAATTSFYDPDPEAATLAALDSAAAMDYEELKNRHIETHRDLFRRVTFSLAPPADDDRPTNERVERVRAGESDAVLETQLFHYARYLTMASSRAGSLPTNLQGMWCDSMTPIWNCNYTINVNLQMSYWAAEAAALGDCQLVLIDFIERLVTSGRKTARKLYGCRGFVAHHTTDLWADTVPTGGVFGSGLWPMGGAWLALHAWEHYRFTGDERFLAERGFPILREAALFFVDFLVPAANGTLVTSPSVSPENAYLDSAGRPVKICQGPTMDSQILRELLTATIDASLRVQADEKERQEWQQILLRLPATQVGDDGRILEWAEPQEEADPGHRHLSHLFGLFPGTQFSRLQTPDLCRAAAETISRKRKVATDQTGWSLAWMACHYARLGMASELQDCLSVIQREHLLTNLFTTCPPLNLDANFGMLSAMLEALLQSHEDFLNLLPALPPHWKSGEATGLRARGGYCVDLKWDDAKLQEVVVVASREGTCRLLARERLQIADQHPAGRMGIKPLTGCGFLHALDMSPGEKVRLMPEPEV